MAAILGALLATRITGRIGPGRAFIAGMFIAAISGIVLAAAARPLLPVLAVLIMAQILRGTGPSLYGVNQQTLRQALIAPALLSRANATGGSSSTGCSPSARCSAACSDPCSASGPPC